MSRLLTEDEAKLYAESLPNYRPNPQTVAQFAASNFTVIAGPAGAGKDTLRDNLIADYPDIYVPILSTTTRPPREGEVNGQTYNFTDLEHFNDALTRKEYLQVALVHNQQLSALHISEVQKLNQIQTGLSILIVQTEEELRAYHPNIRTIFVAPPSLEVLKQRIQIERILDSSEISRRLTAAKQEIAFALGQPHYYCMVSDGVEHITNVAHSYIQTGQIDKAEDERARSILEKILESLV